MHELATRWIQSLAIARQDNEDGRWRFLGMLTFLDPPHPDSKATIEMANLFGLEVRRPRPRLLHPASCVCGSNGMLATCDGFSLLLYNLAFGKVSELNGSI